jgi:hypothetical protein
MKRGAGLAIALLLAACTRESETNLPPKTYRAYGKTWIYRQTEIRTQNPILAALHAGGHGYRERHVIEDGSGERIAVEDRLYALQKDGRFRKVECCSYFREEGELYNFDGRLVFQFSNARKFITDCFIYPAGVPDNERRPAEQQVFGSTVYGEFDPARRIFLISTFDAGQFTDQDYDKSGAGRSIEVADRFYYQHRQPFHC